MLLNRTNQIAARPERFQLQANAQQRAVQVQQVAQQVEENHECEHDRGWRRVDGEHECEECRDYLNAYILEYKHCMFQACEKCVKYRF